MIKKFYLFENSLYSDLNNVNNEEELKKIIGLDPYNYELTIDNDRKSFELSVKEKFIEDFLNLEDGIFRFIFSVTCPSGYYDFYVDDSELDWISRYLTNENLHKLKKVGKFLDLNDIAEDERLYDVFSILGRDLIDYNDIICEISAAKEIVVKNGVNKVLKELPIEFENSYTGNWGIDIIFNIEKIGEYIEENNLEDINTVSDFLENVDFSDLNYELENTWESEFDTDYTDTNKEFSKAIDELIEKMNIPEEKYNDPNQLKLFNDKFDKSEYKFDFDFFSKISVDNNNIYKSKHLGGKLFAWFKSYVFQKNYMKKPDLKKYNFLKSHEIIHPKIKDEYEYLDSANKYNI